MIKYKLYKLSLVVTGFLLYPLLSRLDADIRGQAIEDMAAWRATLIFVFAAPVIWLYLHRGNWEPYVWHAEAGLTVWKITVSLLGACAAWPGQTSQLVFGGEIQPRLQVVLMALTLNILPAFVVFVWYEIRGGGRGCRARYLKQLELELEKEGLGENNA